MTVDVPAGEHLVALRMGSTAPRVVGGLISLVAGLVIIVGLLGTRIWGKLLRIF